MWKEKYRLIWKENFEIETKKGGKYEVDIYLQVPLMENWCAFLWKFCEDCVKRFVPLGFNGASRSACSVLQENSTLFYPGGFKG